VTVRAVTSCEHYLAIGLIFSCVIVVVVVVVPHPQTQPPRYNQLWELYMCRHSNPKNSKQFELQDSLSRQ
jgi:hypothetical protein